MKVTLSVSVPTLAFLVLHDTVQGFYGPGREMPLSYVVVEEEVVEQEPAAEEEVSNAAMEDAEMTDEGAEVEPTDETATEEVAEAETTEDAGAAEEVAEAEGVEEAPVEAASADSTEPAADVAEDTIVAGLTPDEMKAGEAAARACASCHQLARERNAVGPHLVGLANRPVGSIDGFRYSDALMALNEEGAVWDTETLNAWLEDPNSFAPGTKMMFNVRDEEERRLISGWLVQRDAE